MQLEITTDIKSAAYHILSPQKKSDNFKLDMSLWLVSSKPFRTCNAMQPGCRCKGDHQNLGDFSLVAWYRYIFPSQYPGWQTKSTDISPLTRRSTRFYDITIFMAAFRYPAPVFPYVSLCDFDFQTKFCVLRINKPSLGHLGGLFAFAGPNTEGASTWQWLHCLAFDPAFLRSSRFRLSHFVMKRPLVSVVLTLLSD